MNMTHRKNNIQPLNTIHSNSNELYSSNNEDSAYEYRLSSECNLSINNIIIQYERIHTMKENQKQIEALIIDGVIYNEAIIKEMIKDSLDKDGLILELQVKLESTSKDGRKSQVLALLKKHDTISILEIASSLNISTKNVSSQLTYLRQDGYKIFTDHNGRKLLIEDTKVEDDSTDDEDSSDTEDSTIEDDSSTEDDSVTEDDSII